MKITHYTTIEGGPWLEWAEWGTIIRAWRYTSGLVGLMPSSQMRPYLVHSLRFENGQEWDAINGSRGAIRTFPEPC